MVPGGLVLLVTLTPGRVYLMISMFLMLMAHLTMKWAIRLGLSHGKVLILRPVVHLLLLMMVQLMRLGVIVRPMVQLL